MQFPLNSSPGRSALFMCCCFVLVFLAPLSSWAQPEDNNHFEGSRVPTPEAAAFEKNVNIPIGHYTGASSSSVSVYTIKQGRLSLPISLNYNNSGVRVSETASWVGLGWSLNAGGMVNRTTRGIEDDRPGVGYIDNGGALTGSVQDYNELDQVGAGNNGSWDSQPDLFSYSVGGYSGKFFFDGTSKYDVVQINQQDVLITPSWNIGETMLVGFVITTPDGTKYSFSEGTQTYNRSVGKSPYGSSGWRLSSIASYDDVDVINFSYTTEIYDYYMPSGATMSWGTLVPSVGLYYFSPPSYNDPLGQGRYRMEVHGKRLTQISAGTATVDFIASTEPREDLGALFENAHKLDRIEITSGAFCKQYILNHGYFAANGSLSLSPSRNDNEMRLKLESVEVVSCNDPSVNIPKHEFEYYGDQILSGYQFMPDRFSKRIDHWGYYNAASENDGLTILCPGGVDSPYASYCDANRNTNEEAMKIGALKKHTFPTGGYREYDLEANTVADETTQTSTNLISFKDPSCRTTALDGEKCCETRVTSRTETYSAGMDQANQIRVFLEQPVNNSGGGPICGNSISFTISVTNTDGSNVPGAGTITETFTANELPFDYNYNFTPYFPLTVGQDYIFTFTLDNTAGEMTIFEETTTTSTTNVPVGGLRTREIQLHDPVAGSSITKTFDYSKLGTQESSGLLSAQPIYFYAYNEGTPTNVSSPNVTSFEHSYYKDNSQTPLFDLNGYHITYGEVTERSAGANGLTHYEFANNTEQQQGFSFPRAPSQYDHRRGLLLKMTHYKEGATTPSNIVSSTEYEYTTSTQTTNNVMYTLFWMVDPDSNCGGVGNPDQCKIRIKNSFNIRYGYNEMTSETTTTDGVSITKDYVYGSQEGYRYLTEESFTNSDGSVYSTHYTYPEDYSDLVYIDMKDRNILAPIRTVKKVDGIEIDGQETQWGMFSNKPYPSAFNRLEKTDNGGGWSGDWEPQAEILSYQDGRPAEYQKADGWGIETYTWNANGLLTERNYTLPGASNPSMFWFYSYYPGTTLLKERVDADGQAIQYTYDALCRLKSTVARNGNVVSEYSYTYQGDTPGNPNYTRSVITYTPQDGSELTELTTYQYTDGLGRELQTVRQGYAGDNSDVVVGAVAYDDLGRPFKAFETFSSGNTDGSYVSNLGAAAYNLTSFQDDPLGRPASSTHLPDWDYPQLMFYGANEAAITAPDGITYSIGELATEIVEDGNGNTSRTFKDKLGRAILVERFEGDVNGTLLTQLFTTYDDKDRVRLVYPPGTAGQSNIAERIYEYRYDGADNVIYKKVPERGAETIAYDGRDLPIFTESPSIPNGYDYLATVYDGYGRMTAQGFGTGTIPSNPLSSIADEDMLLRNTYGTSGIELTRVVAGSTRLLANGGLTGALVYANLYDTHGRMSMMQANNHLNLEADSAVVVEYLYDYADNLLKEDYRHYFGNEALRTIAEVDYDHSGRSVAQYHQFIRNGIAGPRTQISGMDYTAKDEIDKLYLGATAGGFLQTINYSYKTNGFLTSINNPANLGDDLFALAIGYETAAANSNGVNQFNGNIASLTTNTATGTHHVFGYDYDGLNRLSSTDYYDFANTAADNRYNTAYTYDAVGNIQTLTRSGVHYEGETANYGVIDALTYTYDLGSQRPNRLLNIADNAPSATNAGGFDAQSPNNFTYDDSGNMTYSPAGDYQVAYNHLDLPYQFSLPSGEGTIDYLYSADGSKLQETKRDQNGTPVSTRDYLGTAQYLNTEMQFVVHANGRVVPNDCLAELIHTGDFSGEQTFNAIRIESTATMVQNSNITYEGAIGVTLNNGFTVEQGALFTAQIGPCGTAGPAWIYQYNLTDHLGNNRLLFTDTDNDGTVTADDIIQENHYYAFGLEMEGDWSASASAAHRYRYNGKELVEDIGLYDYGARWYDPSVGRWTTMDPLASEFQESSPYNYVMGNPINSVDPDGMASENCCSGFNFAMSIINSTNDQEREAVQTMANADAAGTFIGGTIMYGGAAATLFPATSARGYDLLKLAFTREKSLSLVGINAGTDAAIQTFGNVIDGKDPVKNYDIIGLFTSLLAFPSTANAIDGFLDVSIAEIEVNSVEEGLTAAAVGTAMATNTGKLIDEIPSDFGQGKNVASTLLGLFNNVTKTASSKTVAKESTWRVPFLPPDE